MRFAIIGEALPALPLARAIVSHPRHELVGLAAAPRVYAQLAPLRAGIRQFDDWEALLASQSFDAVVLSADDPQALAAARRLAEADFALCVVPGGPVASALAYELTLLQADREAILFPLFALRGHPLVARLRSWLHAGELGSVQHVQLERRLPADAGLIAPSELAQAMSADADLLRMLLGEFDQLTAIRSGDAATGVSLATVTLAGATTPPTVWSAAAASDGAEWRLTVAAGHGAAVMSGDPAVGRLTLEAPNRASETLAFDAGGWLLEAFERVAGAARAKGPVEAPADTVALPTWHDLTRNVDLLDAVERSIRKRRTIDIYFDPPSERGTFKTQMTAIGCSLLVATLGFVIAYLMAAAMLDLPILAKRILVALIFLPLALFLALQGLLFVARPGGR